MMDQKQGRSGRPAHRTKKDSPRPANELSTPSPCWWSGASQPIEKLLPLEPKEPTKREEKNRAVVLVIDKSGSMRDDNRITYAKEAAKAVARQLRDIDLLGVVGFDDIPFVVTYLETMARLRGVIDTQIDRLKPGGQTYFLPALKEARQQLERVTASRQLRQGIKS